MVSAQDLNQARIPILTGPTATGKTALALALVEHRPEFEIVNADSMLVYRGMDIGTAKPTAAERASVPHHLIDIRDPDQPFTAGDFVREVNTAISSIQARGKRALIAGGTGFYLKALLYGLWDTPPADPVIRKELEAWNNPALYEELHSKDPESALQIGVNDRYRLVRAIEILRQTGRTPSQLKAEANQKADPRFRLLVIDRESAELSARINERTRLMLEAGLLEEARSLRLRFPGARPLQAVGYAEACSFLDGKAPAGRKIKPGLDGLTEEIELATRQLVKRQRTWFRAEKTAEWFQMERDRSLLMEILNRI